MKCVILAAGEGKRMHPLTYTRPKVMLPIANRPIIEWNLINAIKAGITEFIFIVSYKSEMVRNYFKDGSKWKVNIEYVNQGKPQGTGHAIGIVESFVDDFLVLCGDTIFGENDIKKMMQTPNSMGLYQVDKPEEYGIVDTEKGRVIKIYEKMEKPFTNLINAGIYNFDKSIFKYIKNTKKSQRGEYEITDSINMMAKQKEIISIKIQKWRDVVYPWHLLDANKEILNKLNKKTEGVIEKNTTIKGPVFVGKDTQIMSGTYIEGPVYIGENCKIGPNCYIRPFTSIGNNCHVGNASEIKNSIIMNNSNAPHQNYVGDSIIGENCNLGSGTKVANLKLNKTNIQVTLNGKKIQTGRRKIGVIMGDNVQTGINSMMNVGTMIGNDVAVGPGAFTSGEIKPKSKII